MMAVFICVWVVGCAPAQTHAPTAPPTDAPSVTLIAHLSTALTPQRQPVETISPPVVPTSTPLFYAVQPGDTLLQISRRFGVPLTAIEGVGATGALEPFQLQIGAQLLIHQPRFDLAGLPIAPTHEPLYYTLSPPVCAPVPTNHILCLGQVANPFDEAIERVSVVVNLLQSDGALLTQGVAAIEQAIIPSGASAPYRLLLKADWRVFGGVAAHLQTADSAVTAAERFVSLTVQDAQLQVTDNQYRLTGQIHNPSAGAAHILRAVLTLWNADGEINTYRVVSFDGVLEAGGSLPLVIDGMAGTAGEVASHSLYLEALRLS